MSSIPSASTPLASKEPAHRGSLWHVAILIMLIVFGPALLAWGLSLAHLIH